MQMQNGHGGSMKKIMHFGERASVLEENGMLSHWISKASPSPVGISISNNIGLWDFFWEHISMQVRNGRKISVASLIR